MIFIWNLLLQACKDGLDGWPWSPRSVLGGGCEKGGKGGEEKYRYMLTSLADPTNRCVGFARRRIGRGGRSVQDYLEGCLVLRWHDSPIHLNLCLVYRLQVSPSLS